MTATPSAQAKPERPDEVRPNDNPQEQAFAALVAPYLRGDEQADGWHLIDNADPDDVRHALEASIRRQIAHPGQLAAAALASALDIDGKIVVLRAVDAMLDSADFGKAAEQIMQAGAYTVFVLPFGLSIEALDVEEMRAAGWVPAPKDDTDGG